MAPTCDKPADSGRPIGERQSPDGQEEPKSDSNTAVKTTGRFNLDCLSSLQIFKK